MTCGTIPHPPGTPPHPHPAPEAAAPAKPSRSRAFLRRHRPVMIPFACLPATDATAACAHWFATTWYQAPVACVAAGGVAAMGTTAIQALRKRRPVVRRYARRAIYAGTVWAAPASAWGLVGPHGIVQLALLIPGAVTAARYAHKYARPLPAAQAAPALPPADDPRLVTFRTRFCEGDHAPLRFTALTFTPLPNGFTIGAHFGPESPGSTATLTGLTTPIAKLYDVADDKVTAGYIPGSRSEARGQVTVITSKEASNSTDVWDGRTTYNPLTGCARLGRFNDGKPAHHLLHIPGSGAALTMLAGAPGAGKTMTQMELAADYGQAKMCTRCGSARTCQRCDMQRMVAVFMADPQCHPFGVWRGRADLTAWGPEGCLEMLQLLVSIAEARSQLISSMTWTDHLGRENEGMGHFDPRPGLPLIFAIFDEWQLLAVEADKDMRNAANACASTAVTTFRKTGIHMLFSSPLSGTDQTGTREIRDLAIKFNAIAHRADDLDARMLGIKADPSKLDPNDKGVGYIAGVDNTPGTPFHTKFFREYLKPGDPDGWKDIRGLAEVIQRTPIAYDEAVLAAFEAYGVKHQDVLTEWKGRPSTEAPATPEPAATGKPGTGPQIGGLPTRDDVEAVQKALAAKPAADLYALMEATGLSVADAGRALDLLAANGHITRTGDTYTAA